MNNAMQPLSLTSLTIQHVLKVLSFCAILVVLMFYLHHQAQSLIDGPELSLNETLDLVQHTRTVTLQGDAKNIVSIHLNGKEIYTDEDGHFSRSLVLEDGYTIMTLTAKDRFGRSTSLTKEFVYVPATL